MDDLEQWFDGADRETALLGYDRGELHTLLLLRLIVARTSLRQRWSARTHLLFASGVAQVLSGQQSWQRTFPLLWDASLPDPKAPLALRDLNVALAYIAILHASASGANRKVLAQRAVDARFGIARSTTTTILTAEHQRGNPCLLAEDAIIADGSARPATRRVPPQGANLYPVLSLDAANSRMNPALLDVWQVAEKCDYLNTSLRDYELTCRPFRHDPQTPFQLFGELRWFGKLASLGRPAPLWLEQKIGAMVRHVLEGTPWETAFPLWTTPAAPYRPTATERRNHVRSLYDATLFWYAYVDAQHQDPGAADSTPLPRPAVKRWLAERFHVSPKTIEAYLRENT